MFKQRRDGRVTGGVAAGKIEILIQVIRCEETEGGLVLLACEFRLLG